MPPGPGSDIRMMMGWTVMSKTEKSGVWFFQNAAGLLGRWVFPMLMGRVFWVRKGSYHTVWAVPVLLFVCVRGAQLSGRVLEAVLAAVGRCVERYRALMRPWCADGDVPTAANLNLSRGRNSCVRWHCDGEPLFVWVGVGSRISLFW